MNDIDPVAVESIKKNIEFNNIPSHTILTPNEGDAISVMYNHRRNPFDVVDLDPYGSAVFINHLL